MVTEDSNKENNAIFISYHEKNRKSVEIADQLRRFFESWKRPCKQVAFNRDKRVPRTQILEDLASSCTLLQVFTSDAEASKWMEYERAAFEGMRVGFDLRDSVKVLYTSETHKNIFGDETVLSSWNEIQSHAAAGLLDLVKIDDEAEASRLLVSILFDGTHSPKQPEAKLLLPECCCPPKQPAEPDINELKSLKDFLFNYIDAYDLGLMCVYRDKDEAMDQIKHRLKELKDGELVRMMGFTLHRYVHPLRPKDKQGTGVVFEQAIKNGAIARILLLDRESDAARERMKIESPEEYKKDISEAVLYRDSEAVETYYRGKELYGGRIEIFYYQTPYVGMVLFENCIFVEIYHLGEDPMDVTKNATICGKVPVLRIKENSQFYRIFNSHFERQYKIAKDFHGNKSRRRKMRPSG